MRTQSAPAPRAGSHNLLLSHGIIEGITRLRDTTRSRRPLPCGASASIDDRRRVRMGVGAAPGTSPRSVPSGIGRDRLARGVGDVYGNPLGRELAHGAQPGVRTEDTMTIIVKDLEAFADGWNRHDVDFLMTFMAEGCVFETSAGPEVSGKRYVGREQVREGFAGVFRRFPDVHFGNARHFVSGDRGLSEWTSRPRAPTARRSRSRAATSSPSRATRSQ
jgi:hypothetical protein